MATCQEVEYEFVEDLPEELTCFICMKVLCQPQLMNCCEQPFCKSCLEKWWEKNKSCPHCRSPNFETVLLRQKSRKVGELKVYCPNKQYGCKFILKINGYDNHLSTTNTEGCQYITQSCPKCKLKVFRGSLTMHTKEQCPRRQVFCSSCRIKGEDLQLLPSYLPSAMWSYCPA